MEKLIRLINNLTIPDYITLGLIITLIFLMIFQSKNTDKYTETFALKKFFPVEEFELNWKNKNFCNGGLKYNDGPGVYIILVFDNKRKRHINLKKYNNCYVGQSLWVYSRLHNHFNGKGNGDIYADRRSGEKQLLVKIIKTPKKKLNKTEIKMIARYDAVASGYNKTKGGAKNYRK